MKAIDHEGLALCRFQAELFQTSAKVCNCSSAVFIRRFMNSRAARRMDDNAFLDGADSLESIIAEVDDEYGPSSYGSEHYQGETLYWMGYLYRYWAYTREQSSASVYRKAPTKELVRVYEPYHTLDPNQAIDRIIEAKGGQEVQGDMTEQGVRLLRAIRQRSAFNYAIVSLPPEPSRKH